ncbi:MAG: MGDG synthase family glycosyltransferase [Phycisphaerales bacterium]
MSDPRILVCSAAVGHGHCRAAEIIARICTGTGANVTRLEALAFAPAWFKAIYRSGYLNAIKKLPGAQRWLYRVTDHPCNGRSSGEALERIAMAKFTHAVTSAAPDLVVCSHFLCARVLCTARAKGAFNAPIAVCITDQHPHGVWLHTGADLFLVASEAAMKRVVESGIPAERVRVVGIPVAPEFGRVDRGAARAELGIGQNAPVALLTGGGLGLGGLESAVSGALATDSSVHLIVVCGHAAELKTKVEGLVGKAGAVATIFGFTDRMPQLMAAADVLVGKPGGLTTAESLASGLPMVLLSPIPGQEEANAALLVSCGAAELEPDPTKAGALACRLAIDGARLGAMRAKIVGARAAFRDDVVRDELAALAARGGGSQSRVRAAHA